MYGLLLYSLLAMVSTSNVKCESTTGQSDLEDTPSQVEWQNYQGQLVEDLMMGYNSGIVRPVFNTSTVTTVTFRQTIYELIELDSRNQRITVSSRLKQTWRDEFLQWDKSDYGGISRIHLPSSQIWIPDITLHRNIDSGFERIKNTKAVIESDGTVTWFAPAIFTSSCLIQVRYFPFDTQECILTYSSWAYNGLEMDFVPAVGKDSLQNSFLENGIWDLQDVRVEREVTYYSCCPEPYPEIYFTLVFKRRSSFYVSYLILPCVFLSVLSLLVFYLPAECGEKLSLSITNLLALVVFQQLVANSMPPSGEDPPLIGDYFLAMITMVCCSVVTTVFVIHISAKSGPVPYWAQLLFLRYLAHITCMHKEELDQKSPKQKLRDSSTECALQLNGTKSTDVDGMPGNDNNVDGVPNSVVEDLHFIREDIEDRNIDEQIILQWKHIARVVDRCFLLIFATYAFLTSVVLIIRAKGPN